MDHLLLTSTALMHTDKQLLNWVFQSECAVISNLYRELQEAYDREDWLRAEQIENNLTLLDSNLSSIKKRLRKEDL